MTKKSEDPQTVVYGLPPIGLYDPVPHAVQVSPLIPGGQRLEEMAEASVGAAVMLAPPGTLERRYACAQILRVLHPHAPLSVMAPRDKGGSRLAAELRAMGCVVRDEARQHHRICTALRPEVLPDLSDHLTAGGLQTLPGTDLWTQPGVFSWDRLDAGTAVLLAHLPDTLCGGGVDLGCGIGLLSQRVLRMTGVTDLTLIDVDRRALDAAARNITDPRARFVWADVTAMDAPDTPVDFVVTNPPFHMGGIEDKGLGQAFVRTAARLLRRDGACWLVANRHLPYEQVLRDHFARVHMVHEADGFKIIRAERG